MDSPRSKPRAERSIDSFRSMPRAEGIRPLMRKLRADDSCVSALWWRARSSAALAFPIARKTAIRSSYEPMRSSSSRAASSSFSLPARSPAASSSMFGICCSTAVCSLRTVSSVGCVGRSSNVGGSRSVPRRIPASASSVALHVAWLFRPSGCTTQNPDGPRKSRGCGPPPPGLLGSAWRGTTRHASPSGFCAKLITLSSVESSGVDAWTSLGLGSSDEEVQLPILARPLRDPSREGLPWE
eukprot:scaffold79983_cov22-Tisochrysis_lutea.AAC.2